MSCRIFCEDNGMAVAANIAVAWPSTAASIPAGWTRETALDARYILGAAAGADTDLATDRGNTSHTHTSPSHTPTQNSHTHTFLTLGNDVDSTIVSGVLGGGGVASDSTHGHDSTTSAAEVGTNNGVAITVDATANDLAYVEVIWIKSDGSPATLPTGCLAFYAGDSLPASWSRVHGDRYLKGAAASGDGGTTGGANTHTHTSPAHTHTQNTHSHAATTSATGNTALGERGTGADTPASAGHTHSITLNATTATNQSVTTTIDAANHEPPFKKLNIVQSASPTLPTGIIALWLGSNGTVPAEWLRFTGMDSLWLKGAATAGESNVTTGGSSQHSHTAADCQPIQNAHTHSSTDPGSTDTTTADASAHNTYAANGHKHLAWTVSNETPTNTATTVTIDTCSAGAALPKHRTVIYVTFMGVTPPSRGGVWTSYDISRFDVSDLEGQVLPEVAKKIAQGDLRYVPR